MRPLVGLRAALNSSGKYAYKAPEGVVDHLVVGGGVVGLAIARQLCLTFPEKTTYLVERHNTVGQESSSRNSEVIHSGIYYPFDSLKYKLCIRGRDLLYDYCVTHSVPFKLTKKLVVAQPEQMDYVSNLYKRFSDSRSKKPSIQDSEPRLFKEEEMDVPLSFLSGDEARNLAPSLSKTILGALLSHKTGIVDSHALMGSLSDNVEASGVGNVVCSTRVVRVDPYKPSRQAIGGADVEAPSREHGWVVQTVHPTANGGEETHSVLAKTLITSSGLSGPFILNSLLPKRERIAMYYARGSYFAYSGRDVQTSYLIYPCPEIRKNAFGFSSLGSHLTLDLDGNVKFGPDLDWIHPPDTGNEDHMNDERFVDFWSTHLVPNSNNLERMARAVQTYLPSVQPDKLRPDYVGVRPKLVFGAEFQDFVFRQDFSGSFLPGMRSGEGAPMVTLLGIESPGLTSCLSIAEEVVGRLQQEDGGRS